MMSVPLVTPGPSADVRLNMVERHLPALPAPQTTSCWGRVFQHWTQYVVIVADITAAIPACYGWYSVSINGGLLWTAIPCSAAVVGLTVAFVAIGCLTPRRELESQVDYFRQQVLHEQEINQALEKDIGELQTIREQMQKQVIEAATTVSDLNKLFEADRVNFEKFAGDMGIYFKQANGLLELYQKFREMFALAKKTNEDYHRLNNQFRTQISQLGGTVRALDHQDVELSDRMNRLDTNVADIQGVAQTVHSKLDDLQKFNDGFRGDVNRMTEQVGSLVQKVEAIDMNAYREASKSIRDLKEVLSKFEKDTE
jgi:archaellum component FlaC